MSLSFCLSGTSLAGASWPSRNTCHCGGHVHYHQGGQEMALLCHPILCRRCLLLCSDHWGTRGHALAEDHIPDDGQVYDQRWQYHYARLYSRTVSHGHSQCGRGRLQRGRRIGAHIDAIFIASGMNYIWTLTAHLRFSIFVFSFFRRTKSKATCWWRCLPLGAFLGALWCSFYRRRQCEKMHRPQQIARMQLSRCNQLQRRCQNTPPTPHTIHLAPKIYFGWSKVCQWAPRIPDNYLISSCTHLNRCPAPI